MSSGAGTYRLNDGWMTCPSGIVPPEDGYPWACAVDMLDRPKQDRLVVSKCDAAWVGHKRCDTDKVLGGDAGTRVEGRMMPEHMSLFFPLRDWTHEDVWQYIEENDVPYDKARYMKVDGKWAERPRQRYNLITCMRALLVWMGIRRESCALPEAWI